MDCSLPGYSVHEISQTRILEWVAISFSRGIFPTQGLNLHLLHQQADSWPLSHQRSPVGLAIIMLRFQLSSVTQSCATLCDPMDCSTPGFPVHHQLPELAQTHVHWVGWCHPSHPLLSPSLPSIFPSIRDFSNVSVICIRWPKYWSFSFSISPSN